MHAADTARSDVSPAHPATHHVRPQYRRSAVSQPRCSTEQEGRCQRGARRRAYEASAVSHVRLVHLLASLRPPVLHRSTLLQGASRQVLLPHGNSPIITKTLTTTFFYLLETPDGYIYIFIHHNMIESTEQKEDQQKSTHTGLLQGFLSASLYVSKRGAY